jgi:Ca-activated chloride channel family protein
MNRRRSLVALSLGFCCTFALSGCSKGKSAARGVTLYDFADAHMAAPPREVAVSPDGAAPPGVPNDHIPFDTEAYEPIAENDFVAVADDPLSTFSSDVDTASYSNVRRFLRDGQLPPAPAVRIEELVNYFDYEYEAPSGEHPLAVHTEVGACPWAPAHLLVHVGVQGKTLASTRVPPRNLVFLVDVSGSMEDPDKLPLLKHALELLAGQLRDEDRISIVVYAGAAGLVLPPTNDRGKIRRALRRLTAGGSTNGGDGIQLAYEVAARNFRKEGINRIILATDGDFNVGTSSVGELVELIEDKRETGVFLTVLGFGTGNLDDATMEALADHGNGNYAYIDGRREAEKVLLREVDATLVTIAKDVKLQVELNPAEVASYRLIGYENRALADHEFKDDRKDAGDVGAGHEVTALYEVVPVGAESVEAKVDALKYQGERAKTRAHRGEMMTVKVRYKLPDAARSIAFDAPVRAGGRSGTSDDFRFAAAVAELGMLLRDSKHKGRASWSHARELARESIGDDRHGDRRELVEMIRAAQRLAEG